jgi:CHAD domain-containing protein
MADGKWIENLGPAVSLKEAARRVLEVRLGVVAETLPAALGAPSEDVEPVHQLRVATRRADAAVRIFRDELPKRVRRLARGFLRVIRRTAGGARDWDVFLLDLAERQAAAPTRRRPGLDFLIGYALGQREQAQEALDSLGEATCQGKQFTDLIPLVVNAVREPDEDEKEDIRTLGDLARALLAERLHTLREAATGDLEDYSHLHQVRIAGKKLRYAMEVLADCFDPPFREEFYPQVEAMQEILGEANDSHVASERLSHLAAATQARMPRLWTRIKPGVEELQKFHEKRLPKERMAFLTWWEEWTATAEPVLLEQVGVPG